MSYEIPKKLPAEQLAMALQSAIGALMEEVHEGLRHGHFKMGITYDVNAGRRNRPLGDPRHGDTGTRLTAAHHRRHAEV
jgi:hypothetical protein